jgi:hypothetical protein
MRFENRRRSEPVDLARHLKSAHQLFHAASNDTASSTSDQSVGAAAPTTNTDFETLRWFPYATDVSR